MKQINNGEWGGEPITRYQTAGELLAELLYKKEKNLKNLNETQPGVYANKDCKMCEGRGTVYEQDGEDDVNAEPCDCVVYEKELLKDLPGEVINELTEKN
jgi:hypothetical protein